MRVCFPFVGDTVGGSHVSTLLLMEELQKMDISPVVVLHFPGPVQELLQGRGLVPHLAKTGVIEHSVGNRALLQLPLLAPRLALLLRSLQCDLVHLNDARIIKTWLPAVRLAMHPAVVHIRTLWRTSLRAQLLYSLARGYVAASGYAASHLPESMQRKTTVIPNPFRPPGMDREKARAVLQELAGGAGKYVCFAGTLLRQKRPLVFLRAAAAIHQAMPESRFILFGRDAEEASAARKLSQELSLDKATVFAGFYPQAADVLAGADLVLVPGVDEGFGRIVVEAMMAGAPVVAARSGGHEETVEHGVNGFLSPPDDADTMAAFGIQLLQDSSLRSRIITTAKERAEIAYSPARHAEQVAAVYRELT